MTMVSDSGVAALSVPWVILGLDGSIRRKTRPPSLVGFPQITGIHRRFVWLQTNASNAFKQTIYCIHLPAL
jgi:hypothetical protein